MHKYTYASITFLRSHLTISYFSGPLMVITQRVTSLAYSLQDNLTSKEVNANTKGTADSLDTVQKIPSPLEYFAYTLAFQTLMCGPVVFYNDYINFIEGEQWPGVSPHASLFDLNGL